MNCTPHGMTIQIAALTALGYEKNLMTSVNKKNFFEFTQVVAQYAGHYQNAITAFLREIKSNDPNNPITLTKIHNGLLKKYLLPLRQ